MELLQQGSDLVASLTPESYSQRVPLVFNASVGGHYRHCLDHFLCLLGGFESGLVDYDHRERNRRLEEDPDFAIEATGQLLERLKLVVPQQLILPVWARCEVSYTRGDSPQTYSTFGRELVYAIAHGIHHFAMISVIARLQNLSLPPEFGIAPSTVAHLSGLSTR